MLYFWVMCFLTIHILRECKLSIWFYVDVMQYKSYILLLLIFLIFAHPTLLKRLLWFLADDTWQHVGEHDIRTIPVWWHTCISLSYLICMSWASRTQCSFSCSSLAILELEEATCWARPSLLSVELSRIRWFWTAVEYGTVSGQGWNQKIKQKYVHKNYKLILKRTRQQL